MSKWGQRMEDLRSFVLWECKDCPPDLVLALIQHESGGQIGIQGRGHTRCGELPDVHGNMHELCNALGLMQTIPATVTWYNDGSEPLEKATVEDMLGQDERAARIQIRVGCKYLAYVNHYLFKNFPTACPAVSLSQASDDQINFVLTGYAVGHGAIGNKLKELIEAGKKPTFKNLAAMFPTWGQRNGKWINRPIHYAEVVSKQFKKHRGGSYTGSEPGELVRRTVGTVTSGKGAIAAVLFFAGAAYFINRHFTKPKGGMNEDF